MIGRRRVGRLRGSHGLVRVLLALVIVLSNSVAVTLAGPGSYASAQTIDDETFARQQLAGRAMRTGDAVDPAELQRTEIKKSQSGTHVHFQQRVQGVRVFNAQVVVHFDANRQNVLVTGNFDQDAKQMSASAALLDEAAAIAAAQRDVGVKGALRVPIRAERVIYPRASGAVQAWEVLIAASEPLGDWQILVDATTGKTLEKRNRLRQNGGAGAAQTRTIKLPPPTAQASGHPDAQGSAAIRQTASGTSAMQADGKEITPAPDRSVPKQVPGGAVSVPADKAARGVVDGQASGAGQVVEQTTRALKQPLPTGNPQAGTLATPILSEGFEGVFPTSGWSTFDNDGVTNGEFFWDDEPEQPRTGSWAGWPAGGGAHGVDPRSFYYANNMHAWMVYGPINLSGTTAGSLDFALWAQTEQDYDWLSWMVSVDGQHFYGQRMSGSTTTSEPPTSAGFEQKSLDLSNVFTLGSVLGQPQVWIAFAFDTDASIVDDGPFVDDIRLLISTGGTCVPSNATATVSPADKQHPPVMPQGPKSAPRDSTGDASGKAARSGAGSGPTVETAELRSARPAKPADAQAVGSSDRSAVVQSQGFEGAWPAPGWAAWDNNGPENGDYTWSDVAYQPHSGSWSAWTANAGLDALHPSLCLYPNNQDAWMTYGPVDLSTATAGSLSFWLWAQTEQDYDWVYWLVSIDGQNYYGQRMSGSTTTLEPPTTAGFEQKSLDLSNIVTLGSVLGQPQVWIAFVFQSDGTVVNDGAFVDDIVLDVTTGGGPACTGGPTSGSGLAFRPNPIASSGVTSLVDNDDADSAALNDKRVQVQLQGLDGSGKLRGSYADLTATGISGGYRPAGQACSTDGVHDYPRSDDRFEETVVYYHVDASQRYIQSLGFTNVNNRRTPAHAHYGFSYMGGPNAFYSPANGGLHFFDIYVDIAEDGEVVVHEYGHAVLDNVIPTLWSTESNALHEGFADYLTGTVLDQYNVSSQKLCLAEWFATDLGESCLRRLDSPKHYPEGLQGESHADGEIWAAVLWQIRSALGATAADRVVLEGLFYTDDRGMFSDAALGILQADLALNGGANQTMLRSLFVNRGILTAQSFTLNVGIVGGGTVSGPGINCGADCSESYASGVQVTLTAFPFLSTSGSWSFTGWSGACSGTGSCVLTMSQARSVTATFAQTPDTHLLTVTKIGSGTVTGPGITCGTDCSESHMIGTPLTLTASPSSGWTFSGWSGDCASAGTNPACTISMSGARTVTAAFQQTNAGVVVGPAPGVLPSGDRILAATLSARGGCGAVRYVQFGDSDRTFDNARVAILSPRGGPSGQTSGFRYDPPPGTAAVSITVERISQSGGATVNPIRLYDGCGEWRTFVGGGPNAFR